MEVPRCIYVFLLATIFIGGCSQKPNMGSPVGRWGVFNATVNFGGDGSVVWHNDGQEFNPHFLAPLKEGNPGTWKTDGHDLFLIAKTADGTTETQRYEYSVGTDGSGFPALDISSPKDANLGSYIFKKL